MTKCDFCTESNERGECNWDSWAMRREFCKKAIHLMVKALGKQKKGSAE